MDNGDMSLRWVVIGLLLLVAAVGWGFMAAGYAHAKEGWRSGGVQGASELESVRQAKRSSLRDFVGNAFRQLGNLPAVISHNFSERIWLPITILVIEGLVLFGGWKMKGLEQELSSPRHRR